MPPSDKQPVVHAGGHAHDQPSDLLAVVGLSLAVGMVLMAPVPVLGPLLASAGLWCALRGRASTSFARAAAIAAWVNGVALAIGLVMTVWFCWRYW